MYNAAAWSDLYGEDGQPERVVCPTCEHPCRNEQCVNIHCKDTDIEFVCCYCLTGWLFDDYPGFICPHCGSDVLGIAQFGKQEL